MIYSIGRAREQAFTEDSNSFRNVLIPTTPARACLVSHQYGLFDSGARIDSRDAARFTLTWAITFALSALIIVTGIDPVSVVEYSIVFSVVILPFTYFPVLVVAGDRGVMGPFANGWLANGLGWFYLLVITVAALLAVPLLIITHGGQG